MSKNSPTDPTLIIKHEPNFEQEKAQLKALVQRFAEAGPSAITQEPHPFFGKMTPEEWDQLQIVHLDHHLRQFGA